MALFGNIVIYIIIGCAVVGAAASILKPESELGEQFIEGLNSIGPLFMTIAGIFAAIPFLAIFIELVLGKAFGALGADPSMGAGALLAVDMGAYKLTEVTAATPASWMVSVITSYMLGATIVFTIPVGLGMIESGDQEYFGLGIMSGILCIPVGIFISGLIMILSNPEIPESTVFNDTAQLDLGYMELLLNLIPIIIICLLIALGLFFLPKAMIKGFTGFGKFITVSARIVLVFCIVEYFTGMFSAIMGKWAFDPIVADEIDMMRALEVSGYIGMMLAGAFPMVYLIKRYLKKPMGKLGNLLGMGEEAMTGLLGALANALALFPIVKEMKPSDKVKTISFTVCGAYIIGDHLSFAATFHPAFILPLFLGKLLAGILSIVISGFIYRLYCRKTGVQI